MAPAEWPYRRRYCPAGQRPTMRIDGGGVGFRTSHYLPPTQRNNSRNLRQSNGYSHGWWLEIRHAATTKRRAQNEPLARHPARGLNLGDHTNQEAHDAPSFGAWGSNTGPWLVTPGGASLSQCCCRSRDFVSFLAFRFEIGPYMGR